jgi:AcrR family transcriptional regulator
VLATVSGMPAITTSGGRRSQAERRAATRRALLDAALACLLEDGYGALTTRRVASRAGVSAATLRFHFPTRSAFVAAAVEQLAVELLRQQHELLPQRAIPAEGLFAAWLDKLWEICNGPAFHVMIELSCAARTDENARDSFAVAEQALTRQIARSAADLFPAQMPDARFRVLIDLAAAAMRGLAMFLPIADRDNLDQRWQATRRELTQVYESL